MEEEKLEGSAAFVVRLYQMLSNPTLSTLISWSTNRDSIIIWNEEELAKILPQLGFKTNAFNTFQRQLNLYGFVKTKPGQKNPTEYRHKEGLFTEGNISHLKGIKKKTNNKKDVGHIYF
jgi:heat shock transcription factor